MKKHVTVFREKGRFAGWPANYGIWSWGDEIVVGFTAGYLGSDPEADRFHLRDKTRPFEPMQARSLDGGETWEVIPTPCEAPGGKGLAADEHVVPELQTGQAVRLEDIPENQESVNLQHPDFALMCSRSGLAAGAFSWFYVSTNRCREWMGPYRLPMFGLPGIAARTDYQVLSRTECLLFLTAAKSDGGEGRPFCALTTDGCRSFQFLSWITPEPKGYAIMPASARVGEKLLVAVRCRQQQHSWIDLYESQDLGKSWRYLSRPVEDTGHGGNPPSLTLLRDGRLCLVYGYRNPPFGIRARVSEDNGVTWSPDIVLRDDGGNHDIGYPRTVERADGQLVTVYYFNDSALGERYIAATIWSP